MDDQEQFHQSLRDELIEMNRPKVYHWSACGKEYRYEKAWDTHEARVHSVNTSPVGESTNSSNTAESTSEEQTTPAEQQIDDRYNYATARLNFGMTKKNSLFCSSKLWYKVISLTYLPNQLMIIILS